IVCYRRHGHNEGDEPSFTQPLLYRKIEAHRSVREIYQHWLVRAGVIEPAEAERFNTALQQRYRESLEVVRQTRPPETEEQVLGIGDGHEVQPDDADVETAIEPARVRDLVERLCALPEDFAAHPKIEK